MDYTHLGDTGLEVSRLCLGSAQFGSGQWADGVREYAVGEETSRALVQRALDLGINFVDTANVYSAGESEELIGRAIDGLRDELVLSTKVGQRIADRPNSSGLSRKHILEQAEASLDRLDTDYIDLYQAHFPDSNTSIEESLGAFDQLVNDGRVRYLGASNFDGWQLMKALYTSDLYGYERMVCIEPEYSLVARHEEVNALPVARDQNLGVMVYSPLGSGLLAGAHDPETGPGDRLAHGPELWERKNTDENWTVYDRVQEIADRKEVSTVQVSIAWVLQQELVDSVIIGPESIDQLEECVGALDIVLSDNEIEWIEEPVDPVYPSRP